MARALAAESELAHRKGELVLAEETIGEQRAVIVDLQARLSKGRMLLC